MDENKVEPQDGALENTEEASVEEAIIDDQPTSDERVRELEAELAKYRRIVKRSALKERPDTSKAPETDLLQKAFLRTAGITAQEEVDLALSTAKKWGVSVDQLVDDEDFKVKLEKHRATKANDEAVSDVKGSGHGMSAKLSPEYWLSQGRPPTPDELPDRKVRAQIVRSFIAKGGSSKTFYND